MSNWGHLFYDPDWVATLYWEKPLWVFREVRFMPFYHQGTTLSLIWSLFNTKFRSHERHFSYDGHKAQKPSVQNQEHKEVFGNSICPGNAVGFALVADAPSQNIITEDVPPIILITNNLRKNVGWLPYLRLFKGIVLEADGYFDAGEFLIICEFFLANIYICLSTQTLRYVD